MKSFTIAVVLFTTLVVIIIANSLYITSETQRLITATQALPDFEDEHLSQSIDLLEDRWRRFRIIADISCSYNEMSKIDMAIADLRVFMKEDNRSDYEHTRIFIILQLKDLARLERISSSGLF